MPDAKLEAMSIAVAVLFQASFLTEARVAWWEEERRRQAEMDERWARRDTTSP